jgi:hypothetical protein
VQIIKFRRVTPQQFGERFSMLQQVTGALDPKQQAALLRSLRRCPKPLWLLPHTVQDKATALKQHLLQQLGIDPEQTQLLISRRLEVFSYQAESLVHKATEQGQLLDLEAADEVVQLWTRESRLVSASTEMLRAKLAQLQLLLEPHVTSRCAAAGAVSTEPSGWALYCCHSGAHGSPARVPA